MDKFQGLLDLTIATALAAASWRCVASKSVSVGLVRVAAAVLRVRRSSGLTVTETVADTLHESGGPPAPVHVFWAWALPTRASAISATNARVMRFMVFLLLTRYRFELSRC